jgi:hypothetical protein
MVALIMSDRAATLHSKPYTNQTACGMAFVAQFEKSVGNKIVFIQFIFNYYTTTTTKINLLAKYFNDYKQ